MNYSEEQIISKEEGDKLLEKEEWEFVGETTGGSVYWNNITGELMEKVIVGCYDGIEYGIKKLINKPE